MFPSSSSTAIIQSDPRTQQDRNSRPPLPHSQTQSNMGFTAGPGGGYASWGGGNTGGGLNDPFAPSRSHYQPGYLMSATQSNVSLPSGQHFEDPPLIPTKFNSSASRGSPSEFGLESMFERSTRPRQPTNDEDAPPTASVNDIIDEPHVNPFQRRDSHSGSPLNHSAARRQSHTPQQQQHQQPISLHQPVTYLNVFGYPSDRYESVARLFQSLGDTTEPEPSENGMWFTIGFRQPWEAERALRRNGKLMDDTYMIGVARTHLTATDVLDPPRHGAPAAAPGSPPNADPASPSKDSLVPAFGLPRAATASSLGMPLTLAPSTAAFRVPSMQSKPPQQQQPQAEKLPESSTISKISDMIFGW